MDEYQRTKKQCGLPMPDLEKLEAARKSWQYRAIAASRGNQTPTGLIVLAILRRTPRHPPALAQQADIDQDGVVRVRMVNKFFQRVEDVPLCNVRELNENFNRLADEIKMDDAERGEMFLALRQWIRRDHRVKAEKGN